MVTKENEIAIALRQARGKLPVAQISDGSLVMSARHSKRQAKDQASVFFPQGFTLDHVPESWDGDTFIPSHWLAKGS